jgi:SET domain-containing protein
MKITSHLNLTHMPKRKDVLSPRFRIRIKAKPHNLPDFLEVKESTIKGAGMGMFTKRSLKKGAALGNYIGERLTYKQSLGRNFRYFMHTSADENGDVIDGITMENPMRWANHSAERPNSQPELNSNGTITLRTIVPVAAGEEILYDYGYDPSEP